MNAFHKVRSLFDNLIQKAGKVSSLTPAPEWSPEVYELQIAADEAAVFITPDNAGEQKLEDLFHYNGLTPNEAERLAILAEEMGEALQIVGKILRHGYESTSPVSTDLRTNREMLAHELTDVEAAITMIARDIPAIYRQPEHDIEINKAMLKKLMWSHHQKSDFAEFIEAMDKL